MGSRARLWGSSGGTVPGVNVFFNFVTTIPLISRGVAYNELLKRNDG
jgi:hypothetical protein